jgi:ribosomal protein L11 methylase PrmA
LLPLVSVVLFTLAAFIGYFFLSGFIWGAGYYPTSRSEIDKIGRFLELDKNSTFYDLGSGYGRMVIAIAQRFDCRSIGVEVDPIKCWWTRISIRRKNLQDKVEVQRANFLKVDLSTANAIFVFLSAEGSIMERLSEKVQKECRTGTKIVSYEHKFRSWLPSKQEGHLYLYALKER